MAILRIGAIWVGFILETGWLRTAFGARQTALLSLNPWPIIIGDRRMMVLCSATRFETMENFFCDKFARSGGHEAIVKIQSKTGNTPNRDAFNKGFNGAVPPRGYSSSACVQDALDKSVAFIIIYLMNWPRLWIPIWYGFDCMILWILL